MSPEKFAAASALNALETRQKIMLESIAATEALLAKTRVAVLATQDEIALQRAQLDHMD